MVRPFEVQRTCPDRRAKRSIPTNGEFEHRFNSCPAGIANPPSRQNHSRQATRLLTCQKSHVASNASICSTYRMANPVLNDSTFSRERFSSGTMTVSGAMLKSALLIIICATSAYFSWNSRLGNVLAMGGAVVGFILCLIISFNPKSAPFLAPVYAVAAGLFLGTVSSFFEAQMQGIVLQTVALTGGVFCAMLGCLSAADHTSVQDLLQRHFWSNSRHLPRGCLQPDH